MRPTQWTGRPIWLAELKSAARDIRPIPQLLGQRQTLAGEPLERADQLGRGQAHREEMPRALPGQHRPSAATTTAVPRRAVLVLAVLIAGIASPARTGGQAHLERRVHSLEAAQNAIILRPA